MLKDNQYTLPLLRRRTNFRESLITVQVNVPENVSRDIKKIVYDISNT